MSGTVSSDRHSVHRTLGVLGGGQLGRMMADAAHRLGVKLVVLDPTPNSPAGQAADKQIVGDFKGAAQIKLLASECSVLTVEIEHVNVAALEEISAANPAVSIQPSPLTIKLIQDKFVQKLHFLNHLGPDALGEFSSVESAADIAEAGKRLGYPLMLKSRCLAYDGRGNAVVESPESIASAIQSLVSKTGLYVEKWVPFTKELAVMVARGLDGVVSSYPVVETFQKNSICHTVVAPAQVSGDVLAKAARLAERAVASFDGAGIFGVELFLLPDNTVLLNEIAPRPHNSGHYTIEACYTSQFEQHIRAVMGLPLGNPDLKVGAAVMVNVLGTGASEEEFDRTWELCGASLKDKYSSIHWYGKEGVRLGRKVGHVTVTGPFMADVQARLRALGPAFADSPVLADGFKLAPVVGIIMGSDSDLPTMRAAAEILVQFGVPFELSVVSAHRTPQRMMDYARSAHLRGLKVIIAAAGGAAHLPGMVAAITPLPVIGVPVPLKYLDGQDSLYSIVQMPRGVPVATVAIGNSTNAAILAVRMLSVHAPSLLDKMVAYQQRMESEVMEKVEKLERVGWEEYK